MADPEVDLFAGMKKKKKKVVIDDSEAAAPEPVDTPATATELSKPAAEAGVDDAPLAEASGTATSVEGDKAADDGGDLFADMKKKKKKKKDIPLSLVSRGIGPGCGMV